MIGSKKSGQVKNNNCMFSDDKRCPMQSGMLSDNDIKFYWRKGIEIFTQKEYPPFDPDRQIQPGSVDLRFRNEFKRFKLTQGDNLSKQILLNKSYTEPFDLPADKNLIIDPGEIILATTMEEVHFSNEFAGFITGRSSIARLGVMVQCCQDFINPGNRQAVALQLVNLSPYPVELERNSTICQLIIFKLCSTATQGYTDNPNSKYAMETEVIPSKIFEEISSENLIQRSPNYKRKWLKKWIAPLLPSLFNGTVVMAFVYNEWKGRPVKDVLKLATEIPVGVVFGIAVMFLYIWLKKGDEKR